MWSAVENGARQQGVKGPAAPCARAKHSATLLGGYVYVLGGRGSGGSVPLRDFWRYCLASGWWERLEALGEPPPALQEHTATAHEAKLYVFGGEAGALSSETPLWIYDTETNIWRKLTGQSSHPSLRRRSGRDPRDAASGPRGRRGHSAHALKDCLLIYGGYKDLRGSTNELWAFHYETESWHQVRTARGGPARHRHAAALHDNRLYVHGGQCDLRACADLWHYDTMSRVWTAVRPGSKATPGARSGHAGLRAGAHFYIFGGDAAGQHLNDLWRFHFATETWERVCQGEHPLWPSPRVDARALLVPAPAPAVASTPAPAVAPGGAARPEGDKREPAGFMREISRLSGFHIRRAARCSYSVLAPDRDSCESLERRDAIAKSRSAFALDPRAHIPRDPTSVPDFGDAALPTPALTPAEVTRLVYFDSEEEEEMRREAELEGRATIVAMPKSASVRFTRHPTDSEDTEMSTSDYASAERVNRLSGASLGFSNPHYLGPDVRALGAALTPDSGVAAGDIELRDMSAGARLRGRAGAGAGEGAGAGVGQTAEAGEGRGARLHLLLIGGKEAPHVALMGGPLSMWFYRLL